MSLHKQALTALPVVFIWLFINSSFSSGSRSDIDCLRSIKDTLEDPFNYLASSWNFNDKTEGFICKFSGIECWHVNENKVLNIRLSDMGLKGEFPRGLAYCTALTGLDLSGNNISGHIPSDISRLIPFVTSLDLSSNHLSGQIPVSLANCSYLNSVKLDNNQLTGQIPPELALLSRLKTFSVRNNKLTGPVPNFTSTSINADSYANNPGLCGKPLKACKFPPKKPRTGI